MTIRSALGRSTVRCTSTSPATVGRALPSTMISLCGRTPGTEKPCTFSAALCDTTAGRVHAAMSAASSSSHVTGIPGGR